MIVVYILGALVPFTYLVLVLLVWYDQLTWDYAWGGLRGDMCGMPLRTLWFASTLLTVVAFFFLFSAGLGDWVWILFFVCAFFWVPSMWVDWRVDESMMARGSPPARTYSRMVVIFTALFTLPIFYMSWFVGGYLWIAAFWFVFHHAVLDAFVWPRADSDSPAKTDETDELVKSAPKTLRFTTLRVV